MGVREGCVGRVSGSDKGVWEADGGMGCRVWLCHSGNKASSCHRKVLGRNTQLFIAVPLVDVLDVTSMILLLNIKRLN